MNFVRIRTSRRTHSTDRAGWLAVREMGLIVVILAVLFWLQSLCGNESASTPSCPNGLSERAVYRISLDQTGDRLWVFRPSDGITRKNLVTCEVEQRLDVPFSETAALAHSSDGLTSLWCKSDGLLSLARDHHESRLAQIPLLGDFVVDAAVSHDGATAICATSQGQFRGWTHDESGAREIAYQLPSRSTVMNIRLNRNGNRLCVMWFNGEISFHCPVTGIDLGARLSIGSRCLAMCWSDDERLVGVVADEKIRVYDTTNGEIVFLAPVEGGSAMYVTCVMISPDSKLLAMATNLTPEIRLWNLETGTSTGGLHGHTGIVRGLQFSPTSVHLFSAGYDGTIREWSVTSRAQLRRID